MSSRADALQERVAALAGRAGARGRLNARERLERLRLLLPAIVQTAAGASASWVIAKDVVGHPQPFFAPVASIIALGVVLEARTRRSIEIVLGVALGVLIADAIVLALGTGWAQIALVTVLAMSAAVLLGERRVVIGQAATTGVLVATISLPTQFDFTRSIDALVGGVVALVVHLLVLPVDPRRLVSRRLDPLLDRLAGTVDRIASALAARDRGAAVEVLASARELDDPMRRYAEAVAAGTETSRFAPLRRRTRPALARHAQAAVHLDYAVRNVRVIARGAVRAIDLEANVPAEELRALNDLARAIRSLGPAVEDPGPAPATREHALHAVARSAHALEDTGNLSVSSLTAQIRSAAIDVLRATGEEQPSASAAVNEAADVTPG